MLQGLATQQVKQLVDTIPSGSDGSTKGREATRVALQALTACTGSVAGGSGSCGGAALGAAASVVLNNLLSVGTSTAKGADGKPLSAADQQARSNLVATIVDGIATGAGLDANAATTAASIETQNNALRLPRGGTARIDPVNARYSIVELTQRDAEFKAEMLAAARKAGYGDDIAAFEKAYVAYWGCAQSATQVCNQNPVFNQVAGQYSSELDYARKQDDYLAQVCGGGTPLLCSIQRGDAFLQSPSGVRVTGAFDILGGGIGVVGGTAGTVSGALACPESLGAGCALAAGSAYVTASSADQMATGWNKLWSGTPQVTYGAQALSSVTGMSLQTSEQVYGATNLGVGLATGHLATNFGSTSELGPVLDLGADAPRGTVTTTAGELQDLSPDHPFQPSAITRNGDRLVLNQGPAPTCTQNSCAMILDTIGRPVDPATIIAQLPPEADGVQISRIWELFNNNGVDAVSLEGKTVDDVAQYTKGGTPVVAIIRYGEGAHAVVVDGVTTRAGASVVAVRDPHGVQYFVPRNDFIQQFTGQVTVIGSKK